MKKLFIGMMSILLASCADNTLDRRKTSPNFKDGQFENSSSVKSLSFWQIAWAGLTLDFERAEWEAWFDTEEDNTPLDKVLGTDTRITFVNHATFLIQTNGVNILTDPVFSERVSPFSFIGPKRVHRPGIAIDKLPPIDVIIISHDHYDHLDLDSVKMLIERDNPKIYVGLGVGNRLPSSDNIVEMDWWESAQVTDNFKIWFLDVQHNSGRSLTDRNTTLWGGFLMQINGKQIYFGGDSGYANHYKKAYEQFGSIDIALLPIGAYAPREIFELVHLDPFQAVQAHKDLNATLSIGMHYGAFQLTAESRDDPLILLEEAKREADINPSEFITIEVGKPINIAAH